MILLLAILLAIFVLPAPWSFVIVVLGVFGEVGEIVWGRRLAKRWRPKTGAEAMIGKRAEVVSACRPDGQVRIHGELWAARCAAGADVGDTVLVERLDGLTLIVARPAAETQGAAK
jgi:membrane protein implicated in regulation of membrane protease activity